jgi:hypothetical protein
MFFQQGSAETKRKTARAVPGPFSPVLELLFAEMSVLAIRVAEEGRFVGQFVHAREALIRMDFLGFFEQIFFGFLPVYVRDTAVYRTDFLAGFFAVETDTFRAEVRIDVVEINSPLGAIVNGGVGALGFTNPTVDALIGDDRGHNVSSF